MNEQGKCEIPSGAVPLALPLVHHEALAEARNMTEILLDFGGVADAKQLHSLLKRALSLPDYYGENLDALWDLLGEIETPVVIRLRGVKHLRESMGEYAEKLIKTFRDADAEIEGIDVIIG